jgi:hypothetical protein
MSGYSAPNRPRTVTITFWSVIFLGTWNLGRAIAIGQQLELQDVLNLEPDPRLRLAAAILFTLLFFGLAWQLWRKRPFTINAIPTTIVWYTVHETAVWLLFARPPRNWSLWLISNFILIGSILFTWWALRRATHTYFHFGCFKK